MYSVIWLVLQVGKMAQSCLLRISCFCPTWKSSLFPQNNVLQVAGLANAPSPPLILPPPPHLLYFFSFLCSHLVLSQAMLRRLAFVLFYFALFCFFFSFPRTHLPGFFLAALLKINKNDWYTG